MLQAIYSDGRSTRIQPVDLSIDGEVLAVVGDGIDRRIATAEIIVDERLGTAPRKLRFRDGAFCEVRDIEGLEALLSPTTHRDGWIDRYQHRVAFILLAVVAFVLLAAAGYRWGLPWAAAVGARHMPPAVGKALTAQTLALLDRGILLPSKIDIRRRRRLIAEFYSLRLPEGGTAQSALLFRRSPALGANAFTLPDGTIIVLDELITLLGDDREILAVLAHEMGHAHGHHSLQILLRSSAVGAFLTFYVGDVSQLLAVAPAAIVQARYSQDLEEQADDYGAEVLIENGLSPGLLADALKRLSDARPDIANVGYLSSHPPTDQRMRRLRALADRARPRH